MMSQNLRIIGSSHIARQSIEKVRQEVDAFNPDIIAVELDPRRAYAILHKPKEAGAFDIIKAVGFKGFMFAKIGRFAQKKLGRIVGVDPGSEMRESLIIAKRNNIRLVLIDQDMEITLRRFSKAITWKEKWNFVKDIAKAAFGAGPKINFDIRTVPEDEVISRLIDEVKIRYPNVYKVLIEERNIVMAKRLFHIIKNNQEKRILAVVGAGHKDEILRLLEKYEKEN